MSNIKQMTTQQIQNDLKSINLTWPDGPPLAQADRVNALTQELRKRAAAGDVPGAAELPAPAGRTTAQLEQELRELAAGGSMDESAQTRFADVRYELQRRARAEADLDAFFTDNKRPPQPSASPRQIEIPDEPYGKAEPPQPDAGAFLNGAPKKDPPREALAAAQQPARRAQGRPRKGYRVDVMHDSQRPVIVNFVGGYSGISTTGHLTIDEARALAAELTTVIEAAEAGSAADGDDY